MRSALVGLIAIVLLLLNSPSAAQNRPPVADAGPDRDAFTNEVIVLHGTATDPDSNSIVGWLWTIESSPAGSSPALSPIDAPETAFRGDVPGEYIVSLIASDFLLWSDPDYATITVADLLAPVAVADANPTAGPVPLTVQFDGSQSYDPQGGTLIYDWDFGDYTVGSYDVSPVHTYSTAGTFDTTLAVQSELSLVEYDTVQITVFSGPPRLPDGEGGRESLRVTKLDPDGSQLEVTWDGSCPTERTNLLYGLLDAVATYGLSGSECLVATPHIWDLVPAGGLWFVVVSDDGAGLEGSWGLDSDDQERNGPVASGECGNTTKWTHYYAVCP